jgi:hypothetical protein
MFQAHRAQAQYNFQEKVSVQTGNSYARRQRDGKPKGKYYIYLTLKFFILNVLLV